jgi:hypothetical protein
VKHVLIPVYFTNSTDLDKEYDKTTNEKKEIFEKAF